MDFSLLYHYKYLNKQSDINIFSVCFTLFALNYSNTNKKATWLITSYTHTHTQSLVSSLNFFMLRHLETQPQQFAPRSLFSSVYIGANFDICVSSVKCLYPVCLNLNSSITITIMGVYSAIGRYLFTGILFVILAYLIYKLLEKKYGDQLFTTTGNWYE